MIFRSDENSEWGGGEGIRTEKTLQYKLEHTSM